jgi:hypothetical protein
MRTSFPSLLLSWRGGVRGWLVVAGLLVGVTAAIGQTSREYDVKAVFLFNFATFVDWPPASLPAPGESFVIGVLGQDPFGATLDDVVAGETVRGAPLKVVRGRTLEEIRDCRILFISKSEMPRLRSLLIALRGHPVLTVGDTPQFVEEGGMIGFSTGSRVQLVIDTESVRAARLNISSKLLRVAKVRGAMAP